MKSKIETIETRFKNVTGLTHLDLSVSHIERGANQQQSTTKDEHRRFGFVCTPLWLVDEMLAPYMDTLTFDSKTCDACAGCGQFSIRLMRKFYNKLIGMGVSDEKAEKFIVEHWLKRNHYFTEFQFSNVAKLVYVFGPDINVYAGDSLNMKHSGDNDSGILFFNKKGKRWNNLQGLHDMLVKLKDDLPALLLTFAAIEGKLPK